MNDFNEKFLYHIWDQQHLIEPLKTLSGKNVKINFAGHWNRGKGPDFKNAVIEMEAISIQGDVEIHYSSYDWIAHGHNDDANYNGVVLHVVYEHKIKSAYTIKENGDLIEVLVIKELLSEEIQKLLCDYNQDQFSEKEKYCEVFSIQNEWIPEVLYQHGKERIDRKIKRYQAELSFCSFDQLLYQGIFESLGYSNNKFPFYQLAQQIPYLKLQTMIHSGYNKTDVLSILLHSSDLINYMPSGIKTDLTTDLNTSFVSHNYELPDVEFEWNLFRIRPVNHPVMRLIQILDLIYDSVQSGLINHILKIFSFEKEKLSISAFRRRAQLFISKQAFANIDSKMGAGRIDLILVNVIIPIITLYAKKMEYTDLEEYCYFLLKEFPGLSENTISNTMRKYMTDDIDQRVNMKAIYQQGLIQIYQNYCINHLCEMCAQKVNEIKSKDSL